MSPSVFVFTALHCEAKPLIQHWHLKKHPLNQPFAIYGNERQAVIVSGIGKIAMAGAIGYTLSLFAPKESPILLNLGIAGHERADLGSLYLADKVLDADSGKTFFPQLPFPTAFPTQSVVTHSKPSADYRQNGLSEMEASAFYEMAVKFSSLEFIQCLKIVSDNRRSPIANIGENLVETWVERHLPTIDGLIECLSSLRLGLPDHEPSLYRQLLAEYHFSATNAARLKNLLLRWQLTRAAESLDWQTANIRSGKDLLNWLEQRLAETAFYL